MSRRLSSSDTTADDDIRSCIQANPPRPFIVKAGAGSGKTTSLIKALDSVLKSHGNTMRRRKQQVACITYTEVAAQEIRDDVADNAAALVSTIHSFYWTIVKSFQTDIKRWVSARLDEKVVDLNRAAENFGPRVQQRTRDKNRNDLQRYEAQRLTIAKVQTFNYGMGSDYSKGILGHDDIIKLTNYLLSSKPLFRQVVATRFPFVFIDESQDAMPDVVAAFKAIEVQMRGAFCVGFFGDPMQKIYLTGIGNVAPEVGWREIDKPENYRCATTILSVANKVRAGGDALVQVGGRKEVVGNEERPVAGSARFFIVPSTVHRDAALKKIRNWTAEQNHDENWASEDSNTVKVLVIVHRMAANRLGFGGLYAALNDSAPEWMKQGFQDGSAWPLRPFLSFVLPLCDAVTSGDEFGAMVLLRAYSPKFARQALVGTDVAGMLREVRQAVVQLSELMEPGGESIRGVLKHIHQHKLLTLDERLLRMMEEPVDAEPVADGTEVASDGAVQVNTFLACAASELLPYRGYLLDKSAFATQHGVKGAEFDRVMVVMDDANSDYNLYSYEKYFDLVELSPKDIENAQQGIDNVVDRTRRLLYVCCTRAKRDLVLVLFTNNVEGARKKITGADLVPDESMLNYADLFGE